MWRWTAGPAPYSQVVAPGRRPHLHSGPAVGTAVTPWTLSGFGPMNNSVWPFCVPWDLGPRVTPPSGLPSTGLAVLR